MAASEPSTSTLPTASASAPPAPAPKKRGGGTGVGRGRGGGRKRGSTNKQSFETRMNLDVPPKIKTASSILRDDDASECTCNTLLPLHL